MNLPYNELISLIVPIATFIIIFIVVGVPLLSPFHQILCRIICKFKGCKPSEIVTSIYESCSKCGTKKHIGFKGINKYSCERCGIDVPSPKTIGK